MNYAEAVGPYRLGYDGWSCCLVVMGIFESCRREDFANIVSEFYFKQFEHTLWNPTRTAQI